MTYPIGTQLLFKKLTQASAAADLFGEDNVKTAMPMVDGKRAWVSFFSVKWLHRGQGLWGMDINTPEKQKWFLQQVGDVVLARFYSDEDRSKPRMEIAHLLDEFDTDWINFDEHEEGSQVHRIAERNNKPFPQPCEVIVPACAECGWPLTTLHQHYAH
jgi:hypothetical protein